MSRIITIGESAYDILFKGGKPYDGKVGGAVINTSISLGRLNKNVILVGNVANDRIGQITREFLIKNNIDIHYFTINEQNLSRVALAFLDTPDKPEYLFFKPHNPTETKLRFPDIKDKDIILFGSLFSILPQNRKSIEPFLYSAKEKGAILIYDPNFRKNHLHQLKELLPNIKFNIEIADIIKGSDEDFSTIFFCNSLEELTLHIPNFSNKVILYTQGKKSVIASIFGTKLEIEVQKVKTKSAIGAGDSFNAGLIFSLDEMLQSISSLLQLSIINWYEILENANHFAAHVCSVDENYISQEFANEIITNSKGL